MKKTRSHILNCAMLGASALALAALPARATLKYQPGDYNLNTKFAPINPAEPVTSILFIFASRIAYLVPTISPLQPCPRSQCSS